MLNYKADALLILSIFTQMIILKSILTYNKDTCSGKKFSFFILLALNYSTVKMIILFNRDKTFDHNIIYILTFIMWGVYYNYFYKIGIIKYIVSFFLFDVYYSLIRDVISRNLFFVVTGNVISSEKALLVSSYDNAKVETYTYLVMIVIYLIVYLTFRFLSNKLQLYKDDKINYIYLSIALMANLITIIIIYINKKMERVGGYSELYVVGYIVTPKLILVSSLVIIVLFIKIIRENKIQSQNEIIKNKLDMQYSHYLSIQESHIKVKKLYHDINNHICCIENLKNNNVEINEYVSSLKDEIKEFKSVYNTGNIILDIIVNEKSDICTKKGIKFICDINFLKVNFIRPIDVSSIFANVLDNAIEACDKIHDEKVNRYIITKGTISKSYFVIKCENSKVNILKFNKNKLLTDKMDKFIHGIGIQSIKSSLEKYNGEILFEDDKEKFTVNIFIPLNQNNDSWVD
ncbi:ATP-binding protein [Romboutsia lituseburensis]|uniref:ATP-binding protein n=1 Tax=Romboutsia lituseburensis TaxID=1537 RepID=UPI00215AA9A4|nr:ATP-binding protein [Romboutsia lituseburensis]MCR8746259.1 ATP-binding protein [Romboutsia lituseburensis]